VGLLVINLVVAVTFIGIWAACLIEAETEAAP
jgi:hypothetical protein